MTVPGKDELLFLALGGAGEIGMNLNLYGHAGKWLMIDLGIGFADDSMPGVEVVMPDPAFIEERRDDLEQRRRDIEDALAELDTFERRCREDLGSLAR